MKNYYLQDSCHNCKNVFQRHEYDECMSVAMDDCPPLNDLAAHEKEWDEKVLIIFVCIMLLHNLSVLPWGKCDAYEKQ